GVERVEDALAAGRQADAARVDESVRDDRRDVDGRGRTPREPPHPEQLPRVRVERERGVTRVAVDPPVPGRESVRSVGDLSEPRSPEQPAGGELERVHVAVEILD